MNLRPHNLTIAALSALVLCLAPVSVASASTKQASVSGIAASAGAKTYDFSGTKAGVSGKKRAARRSQENSCGDVDAEAGEISEAAHARSVVCLLNRERTSRGLRALSVNSRLSAAAERHNRDMIKDRYFAHGDSVGRIRSSGYLNGARSWIVGENLAWGSGSRSTPAALVQAWMESPGHRHNVLTARFREIGVGVDFAAPVRIDGAAATYTTTFGGRS